MYIILKNVNLRVVRIYVKNEFKIKFILDLLN